MAYQKKVKKTQLQWNYCEERQLYTAELKPINWLFLIDGWSLNDKWIPCLQYIDEKEENEICLSFNPVTLKTAKSICQRRFDTHVKNIVKYFV